MLCINSNQSKVCILYIGDYIKVVVSQNGSCSKIGIEAPKDMLITKELVDREEYEEKEKL